jgi:hypothetical protein
VTSIGISAFDTGANLLTGTLRLSNNLVTIGNYAFIECQGLIGDLTLPNTLTHLGTGAFDGCGFNGQLTLPTSSNFTEIPMYAFHDTPFSGTLVIPNNIIKIYNYAFSGCTNFDTILCYYDTAPENFDSFSFDGLGESGTVIDGGNMTSATLLEFLKTKGLPSG